MNDPSVSARVVLTPDEKQRRDVTFFYERIRAVAHGMIETAAMTFLVYIAVQHYHASVSAKAFLAAGGNYGLLLTPLVYFIVHRGHWQVGKSAAALGFLGGTGFLLAALVPTLPIFVAGSLTGLICSAAAIPLLTQIYQDNYPQHERGRLFSRSVIIRILTAATFSYLAGRFLQARLDLFQWLLVVFALALYTSAYCLLRTPSQSLRGEVQTHPFRGLRYLKHDPLFRLTLISWMLMGIANLMMVQMRVEFLANPVYGEPLSAEQIALVTGVIPNAARLLLSGFWGRLFDRMNFFGLRILLNIGFALSGLVFFTGRDTYGLIAGAVVFGIANAGGDIAWSLWVTKLAPPDRVAEYMSVHTFFTGVRGVLAPHLAFFFVTTYSFTTLSIVCAVLILGASGLLFPEMRAASRVREAQQSAQGSEKKGVREGTD